MAVQADDSVRQICPRSSDTGSSALGKISWRRTSPMQQVEPSKNLDSGYSVTVTQGSRGIMVRIMEQGGSRTNYYRVSIPGKQTFAVTGEVSTDPALTHIPISGTSLQDILDIIAGIGQ